MKIADLIENINIISLEDIYKYFESTEDVFIIKYDGVRIEKKYTIIIIGKESRFETIRLDCSNIKEGLLITLKEYMRYEESFREMKSKINMCNNDFDTQKLKNPIHDEKITYSIISRGEMIIDYSSNAVNFSVRVTRELTFQPPIFYADLSVFEREVNLSEDIKKHIINFIENDSENKTGTKIIFD